MTDININQFSETINDKADRDLRNLSSPEGEAHFANPALTNSPYTTNRILEIPQDIKLELNNGTLTLKAGSKVYIPNGSGTFDSFTLLSDAGSGDISDISTDYLFFVNSVGGLSGTSKARCYSGTVEPTGTNGVFWYDTTNNVVKRHNGTSWVSGYSLPFCVISSGASYIDQIFNGFGYIGNVVFILPGIRCQIGTGTNDDGTYTSIVRSVTKVFIREYGSSAPTPRAYCLSAGGDDTFISLDPTLAYFDSERGYYRYRTTETSKYIILCSYMLGSKISEFKQSSVDSIINSNASNFSQAGRSYLSGLGMPSDRYINLTLGASGATYTMPANGLIVFDGTGSGSHWQLTNQTRSITATWLYVQGVYAAHGFLPVMKGDVVAVKYSSNKPSSSGYFRFVYAEGEN